MVCATSTADRGAERGTYVAQLVLPPSQSLKAFSSFQPHRDANIEERCIERKDPHAYMS
jgi:hypothetical protein